MTVSVSEGLDRRDMQERDQRPTVGSGPGDEQAAAHGDGKSRVTDIVHIPAAQADAERLKGFLVQEFLEFLGIHAPIIAIAQDQVHPTLRTHYSRSDGNLPPATVFALAVDLVDRERRVPADDHGLSRLGFDLAQGGALGIE